MRPARRSAALAALFGAPGVQGAQLRYELTAGTGHARALLMAQEWRAIRHCREARIRDFTAGRLCARRALQGLGVRDFSLLAAPDRRPLWPAGIVGSITHTHGYSAAVVARADSIAALGIDTEVVSSVHARLWPLFCTPGELDALGMLASAERAWAAALTFAAKEAYFKCQYPLTQEPLGFDAVQIEHGAARTVHGQLARAQPRSTRGRFWVLAQRGRLRAQLSGAQEHEPHAQHAVRLEGRYRRHGPYITVAVAVAASALSRPSRP
jgi:4'-phosphopantetheinyl transferase EntD